MNRELQYGQTVICRLLECQYTGGKVNILRGDAIGHCERKGRADRQTDKQMLILNGYRVSAVWTLIGNILIENKLLSVVLILVSMQRPEHRSVSSQQTFLNPTVSRGAHSDACVKSRS
jgi:hypothetical protein